MNEHSKNYKIRCNQIKWQMSLVNNKCHSLVLNQFHPFHRKSTSFPWQLLFYSWDFQCLQIGLNDLPVFVFAFKPSLCLPSKVAYSLYWAQMVIKWFFSCGIPNSNLISKYKAFIIHPKDGFQSNEVSLIIIRTACSILTFFSTIKSDEWMINDAKKAHTSKTLHKP